MVNAFVEHKQKFNHEPRDLFVDSYLQLIIYLILLTKSLVSWVSCAFWLVMMHTMLARHFLKRSHLVFLAKSSHSPFLCIRGLVSRATPSPDDPFANGTNTYYAEAMYRNWNQNPYTYPGMSISRGWTKVCQALRRFGGPQSIYQLRQTELPLYTQEVVRN